MDLVDRQSEKVKYVDTTIPEDDWMDPSPSGRQAREPATIMTDIFAPVIDNMARKSCFCNSFLSVPGSKAGDDLCWCVCARSQARLARRLI